MNFIRQLPSWEIAAGVLFILALFFKVCMRGYDYIAYTLAFAAVLVIIAYIAPAWFRTVTAVLVAAGMIYFISVEIPIIKNSFTDEDCERQYLIVLGAAVHGDEPSLALTHRLEGAEAYLNKYPEAMAILSGGKGDGENISEAECMYNWLRARGIPEVRLLVEPRSTSTAENLQNSFAIIRERGDEPEGNVALLSSSYHLCRAKRMAEIYGVDAAGVAGNPGYPVYMLNCYIREAFGLTHLHVFGP